MLTKLMAEPRLKLRFSTFYMSEFSISLQPPTQFTHKYRIKLWTLTLKSVVTWLKSRKSIACVMGKKVN
jgi:hypothetical protein